MIDVSDGLSTDLEHICQESHVGAEIEAEAIPRARVGWVGVRLAPTLDAMSMSLLLLGSNSWGFFLIVMGLPPVVMGHEGT